MPPPGHVESGGAAMPQRHEVQNLVRRGNTFYWRPRVPSRFRSDAAGVRLSLSLKQSDHRKAAYVARRLNTLLHDLALKATARMTTKEQLATLFSAEIERMRDHLDEQEIAARRFGGAADVTQLEADIEVGWAYRLLQVYGTMATLTFDEGCPAITLLRKNGIPAPHIANIVATFRSEQLGSRRGVFEKQVAAQMAEVGLKDTAINRERAMSEIFRAKADVLLDVADRYPGVDREQSLLTRTAQTTEQPEYVPARPDETTSAIPPVTSPTVSPPLEPATLAAEREEDARGQAQMILSASAQSESSASTPVPEARIDPKAPRNLPVSAFKAEAQNLINNHNKDWAPDCVSACKIDPCGGVIGVQF